MRRFALLAFALLALAAVAAGGSGTWAAFSSTTSTGPGSLSSAPDWTAPTVTASVIAHSASGSGVKSSGTYAVYANVTDTGNPASGVSTVTANVNSITTGQTAVALTACSSSCTVGGVTYAYKSATLSANSGLTGGASINYTVTPKDAANNAGTAQTYSVTVDNTAPTSLASGAAHATAGARIKAGGTYFVYANATDAGSGVDTVTANVNNVTTGQTAVPLTACSSSCTVGATTYAYKSASLTANAGLSANQTYSITATDSAGNATTVATFTATVDNIVPTASAVATANGSGTLNRPDVNDTVTLTFSEQMDPATILTGWSGSSTPIVARISNAGGAAHDFVTFWNSANTTLLTTLGNVDLGRAGYVNTGATVTFGASGTASSMVQSAANVTITLGTTSTTANTVATTTTMIWNSSPAPADLAGNLASGNARTEGGTADAEF
jgi:large repetitive protein